MQLINGIRQARRQPQGKQPWPLTVWAVVAAIVRDYDMIEVPPAGPPPAKPPVEPGLPRPSLFPLVTAAQMRRCQEIIEKFHNPYLVYARAPQDFQASLLLFARRPDLPAEVFRECPPREVWQRECGENPGA